MICLIIFSANSFHFESYIKPVQPIQILLCFDLKKYLNFLMILYWNTILIHLPSNLIPFNMYTHTYHLILMDIKCCIRWTKYVTNTMLERYIIEFYQWYLKYFILIFEFTLFLRIKIKLLIITFLYLYLYIQI